MQTVSQGWKDNQNETLVSESFVEVTLSLSDPDALADARAEDNGASTLSATNEIVSEVEKNTIPYATLEPNLWVLDGNRKLFVGGTPYNTGYVGAKQSSAALVYNQPYPMVVISFSEVHTNVIPGITLTWSSAYNEYAIDFTVKVMNGGTVLKSTTITNNTDIQNVIFMDIANYDTIQIIISKWSDPVHRPRVEEVVVGIEKVYGKTNVFSFEHSQTVDPISSTLPKSQITFSIDNSTDEYNLNNLEGLSKYLIERQEIKAKYGFRVNGENEWIDCGTFYMSEWNAPQKGITASFTARDLFEFMTDTYYYGVYSPSGRSLYDLATDVLTQAKLPLDEDGSVKWVIHDSLKNIKTVAPLPVDTLANCLQLIANAAGCVMYQDRRGKLHIEPLQSSATDYAVTLFNSYSPSEITLAKPLKQVEVSSYSYSVAADEVDLYEGTMTINGTADVLVTYPGSATNVTGYVSGGTLNSANSKYYANACVLNITATGNVNIIVSGYSLETSAVKIITGSSTEGETVSVDNPLITTQAQAVAVGAWVESYMSKRMVLTSEWRADPRLDALDIVQNENDYSINPVRMTSVTFTYNGAFRGKGEGRVI